MTERAERLAFVFEFAAIVLIAAFISAWAHLAADNQSLRFALYAVVATIGIVLAVIGAVSILVNVQGHLGITLTSVLLVAIGAGIDLPLIRPVRAALATVMPFDADSVPDMTGLSVILATAILIGGTSLASGSTASVGTVNATELITQAVAFVFIAYFGVGFLMTRDFRNATDRLGLHSVTTSHLLRAVLLVVALFTVTIVSSYLTVTFQPQLESQIQENLGTMTQGLQSWGGALILGISAGVGEEILFRGAMQPRYGIIFTSIVFASLHVQYGPSLTILGIFVMSVLLGIERKRVNTTASLVTHVVYDVLAVLIPVLLHGS